MWTNAAWRDTVNTVMKAITNIRPSHSLPIFIVGRKVYLKTSWINKWYVVKWWQTSYIVMDSRDETIGEYFLN